MAAGCNPKIGGIVQDRGHEQDQHRTLGEEVWEDNNQEARSEGNAGGVKGHEKS